MSSIEFSFNSASLNTLFGQQSDDVNVAFGKKGNIKVHLSIKGKRKVFLVAKAWLAGERGYKWFSVRLGEFMPNESGLGMLTGLIEQAEVENIFSMIQRNGK